VGFLSPWFLAGLIGLGLPVYIHLLRRHTTVPRPVSSLMFFEQGTQSSTRHRRLQYLLLFSLRALLLVLLVLAFADPFLQCSKAGAGDTTMLVVIDNSFSMQAGTRLADAKRDALSVLSARTALQRAQVLVLGSELQVLTQPIQDAGALRAAVMGVQPSDAHGNFGDLGRGVRAIAETIHTPIQLHLFSDMQRSNMPANFSDMVTPGNVSIVLHRIGADSTPNWTVESVDVPSQLVDPKKASLRAIIAGHQTPAASRNVSLIVNGAVVATRQVQIPADGRASVTFDTLEVPYGWSRCAVRIDAADGFLKDDSTDFAVRRGDPERVLFVHQASDTRSPFYFGAALSAVADASFVLQPITPEQAQDVDPSKYAFVVLSDVVSLPSLLENNLRTYVQDGGNMLIAAGTSAAHRERIPVFDASARDANFYSRQGSAATVAQADMTYPAMKGSAGWPDEKFFYATVVDPGNARVVARLGDGTPLLLDRQIGEGHVLLFTSGFDNLTNDLPLYPGFVAFVDQTARLLSGNEQTSGMRLVDSFIPLRSTVNSTKVQGASRGTSIDVIGPNNSRPLPLSEERSAETLQLKQAGFYQIRFANGHDALIAVNPDRRESDLMPIAEDTLTLWTGSGVASNEVSAAESSAQKTKTISHLWWWAMLLVLITAMAESVVASQYLGTQREEA
jgi:hypothetical protein